MAKFKEFRIGWVSVRGGWLKKRKFRGDSDLVEACRAPHRLGRVVLGLVAVTLTLRDRACTSTRPSTLVGPTINELRLPPLAICAVASSLPPQSAQSGATVTRRPAFVSGAQKADEASRRCFLLFTERALCGELCMCYLPPRR